MVNKVDHLQDFVHPRLGQRPSLSQTGTLDRVISRVLDAQIRQGVAPAENKEKLNPICTEPEIWNLQIKICPHGELLARQTGLPIKSQKVRSKTTLSRKPTGKQLVNWQNSKQSIAAKKRDNQKQQTSCGEIRTGCMRFPRFPRRKCLGTPKQPRGLSQCFSGHRNPCTGIFMNRGTEIREPEYS